MSKSRPNSPSAHQVTLQHTAWIFHHNLQFKSVSTLYRQLPNMSKNSATHPKKVEHAVQKILKVPGLSIPDAMVLANFLKKDVANETVRRAVHWAVKLCQDRALLGLRAPPDGIVIIEDPSPSLLTCLQLQMNCRCHWLLNPPSRSASR